MNADRRRVLGSLSRWLLVLIKLSNPERGDGNPEIKCNSLLRVRPRTALIPGTPPEGFFDVSEHRQFSQRREQGSVYPLWVCVHTCSTNFYETAAGVPQSHLTHTLINNARVLRYTSRTSETLLQRMQLLHIQDPQCRSLTHHGPFFKSAFQSLISFDISCRKTPDTRSVTERTNKSALHQCFFLLFALFISFFAWGRGMTHEKKQKRKKSEQCATRSPRWVSHSMICCRNCWRTRLSGSDLNLLKARSRLFEQFLFQIWRYSDDAHQNAETVKCQQPCSKLNHLYWTFY